MIVVGDSAAGKTSIINAWCRGETAGAARPTIGVAFSKRSVALPGLNVSLQIWDTAGQEKFRSVNTLYYRNAAAAVIVYDITNPASFASVSGWLEEIRRHGARHMIIVLVGNKVDLKASRLVGEREARDFAESNGLLYMETSAKTGVGINEIFRLVGAWR